MLYGEKTRPVADFLPRVLIHIDGIDVDLATTYIMDSIIHFAREAKVLTERMCIDLDPCLDSYKVHTKHRILEVMLARLFVDGVQRSTKEFDFRIEGDTLYTPMVGTCGHHMLELTFVVAPERDSLEVPDIFYEDWVEPIVALTLSKLYLLTDNEWYNPQASANQQVLYQQLVRRAHFSRISRHKPFQMRLDNKRRL